MQIVFAYPHLWGTLLAVPLALWLALLARRERRVVTASLLPWRAVLALPRPRPTRNPIDLEMLCALLLPLASALALMGITLLPPHKKNAPLIVVLDNSISMASVGADKQTRWQHAQAWLAKITAAHPDAPLTVYISGQAEPLLERGRAGEGRVRLAAITPSQNDAAPATAVLTNAVRRAKRSGGIVVWISDRVTSESSPHLARIIVGEASRNLAITTAKTIPGNAAAVFVAVQNFSLREQAATLTWRVGAAASATVSTQTQTKKIRLGAGAVLPLTIPLAQAITAESQSVEIALQDWADDLAADNRASISLGHTRSIALDAKAFPRATLALKTVAGFAIRATSFAATTPLLLTSDAPRELPTRGIILYAPTKASCGLVSMGAPVAVTDARVRVVSRPLPSVCVAGLDQFSLREVGLPAGAEILAAARVVERAGEAAKMLPLVAIWKWRGVSVAYLGVAPHDWTGHPAYPIMLAELAERLLPPPATLPGRAESDNQMRVPATTVLPPRLTKNAARPSWPLARWLAGLAMLAGGYVAWCEWSRVRATRRL